MRGPARMAAADRERWRRPALAAVSLAIHTLALGFMALQTVDENRRYGQGVVEDPRLPLSPILIEMEPPPLLHGEAARTRAAPEPDPYPHPVVDAGARDAATGAVGSLSPADRPTPPAPRLARPVEGALAPPAEAGAVGWTLPPRTLGDRIGQGLRTRLPGCAFEGVLTPAEQAVCDTRFGERAAAAAPIAGSGDAERDAGFAAEGARALANYERRRRPLAGGVGVVGIGDGGPGSNFGTGSAGAHLDPSLRPDSTENIRTRRREGPRD